MERDLIGAVEAGGTKFILALARSDGEILSRTRIATGNPQDTLALMARFFEQAAQTCGPIRAFGIASFGPIDIDPASPRYGTFTTTPKPGWSGVRYHDVLARFGAPIAVDTDVNGAAIAEWQADRQATGQSCGTLAYTTVGTGIGTGIVRDGVPLSGFFHYESGHILVPHDRAADPFAGSCPVHVDCLEGLASGSAIRARFGASLDTLGDAEGDLIAGYLAHLAATLVLLHMPDRLVFGGGVMKTTGLIERVRRHTLAKLGGYIRHPRLDEGLETYIALPTLADDAGITGAVELGRRLLARHKA